MRTAKEVLEDVRIYGRRISEFLLPDQIEFIEKAMVAYAQEAIEEQLQEAAESATLYYDVGGYTYVDTDSIMNCKRVEIK